MCKILSMITAWEEWSDWDACPLHVQSTIRPMKWENGFQQGKMLFRCTRIWVKALKQPLAISLDMNMLRGVCQVLAHWPDSDISGALAAMKKFIASDIDPVIEANWGVPGSSPRYETKEKIELAFLKCIYQVEGPNFSCVGLELIQQCLLDSLSSYTYSSIPMMSMLSDHLQ